MNGVDEMNGHGECGCPLPTAAFIVANFDLMKLIYIVRYFDLVLTRLYEKYNRFKP